MPVGCAGSAVGRTGKLQKHPAGRTGTVLPAALPRVVLAAWCPAATLT